MHRRGAIVSVRGFVPTFIQMIVLIPHFSLLNKGDGPAQLSTVLLEICTYTLYYIKKNTR